jgi:predicted nucleic acid-binding protein
MYEYWVVATRPRSENGLGISDRDADADLTDFLRDYRLLEDASGVFEHSRSLVTLHQVQGKKAHDARLIAAMLHHGLAHLLSFNDQDFSRFSEINVIVPGAVTRPAL